MNLKQNILRECTFKTARSGGAGGQHVNKVETKVIIIFSLRNSFVFYREEKELIEQKLKNKLNKDGELVVAAQTYKSQIKNKKLAQEKLLFLIENALKKPKRRKKTKIPKGAKEKRLKIKQIKSDHKKNRQKIRF